MQRSGMLHMADRSGALRDNPCLDVLRRVMVLEMNIIFVQCWSAVGKRPCGGQNNTQSTNPPNTNPTTSSFPPTIGPTGGFHLLCWGFEWDDVEILSLLSWQQYVANTNISGHWVSPVRSSHHVMLERKQKSWQWLHFTKVFSVLSRLTRAHLSFISTAVLQNVENCSSRLFSLHQHWNPLLCL